MRSKLKEYLDIEISGLGVKKGLPRLIYFLKKMRYDPSSNAIFMLRFCDMYQMDGGLKKFLCMHYRRLLINRYGIFFNLNHNSHRGKGLFLPHPSSIVFGAGVNIGENCVVYQNVTFGAKKKGFGKEEGSYPQVGNNCVFYAGATIIGPIQVGDGTQVGANSVLICDTEKSSIYAGVPAVRKR
ncbi:MAG: serine acetyltransferase [Clostridia bacterium]|nr:serine acetyltransferase [Clostridia bacterium]MBR4576574.1 serine acetyltransferase [Clostridia bacterium]